MGGEDRYVVSIMVLHERMKHCGKGMTDRAEDGIIRHDIPEGFVRHMKTWNMVKSVSIS